MSDKKSPGSIHDIQGLSTRTLNTLIRANITEIGVLLEMTDHELLRIRNFGEKCLAEINAALPGRCRTYDGEAEFLKSRRKWGKTDAAAGRILRYMATNSMKLSELMASGCTSDGRLRARQILTEYCLIFPEHIGDVICHSEDMWDTSDRLYLL